MTYADVEQKERKKQKWLKLVSGLLWEWLVIISFYYGFWIIVVIFNMFLWLLGFCGNC
jgi:hypothetical protein